MSRTVKSYPVEEAVKLQKALRAYGEQEPETFPIQAFVGMISDEIEHLRKRGHSDEEIAQVIAANSDIEITASEIAQNYSLPEDRRHP